MSQPGLQKQPSSLISVLGEIMEFKVTGEETAGSFCVIELTAFPHNGPPPHIHHREDESFYVLDGSFSFLLGDRTIEAGPGFSVACLREPFTGTKTSAQNPERRWSY
jgi:mannose-6-phosphate isomerase-like protein (cupin superfamily)